MMYARYTGQNVTAAVIVCAVCSVPKRHVYIRYYNILRVCAFTIVLYYSG